MKEQEAAEGAGEGKPAMAVLEKQNEEGYTRLEVKMKIYGISSTQCLMF